jgi:trehalose transport system substrate-binding protein
VNLVSQPAGELSEELKRRPAAPAVQLFAHDNVGLWPLVAEHLVQDLSDVRLPGGVAPVGVPDVPADFGRGRFFLPFRPNVRLAYVNREALEAAGRTPPETVESFAELARVFKKKAGAPKMTISLARGDTEAATLAEWICSFGGDPVQLGDEGSVAAFTMLQKLWREGLFAPRESLEATYESEPRFLEEGTSWFAENWSYTSAILQRKGLLDRFEVYPGWSGPAGSCHVVGGNVLAIPVGVKGKEREAAIGLAKFLLSKEAQEYLLRHNAWASVRDDVYDHVPVEQRPTVEAVRAALKGAWYRPMGPHWDDVQSRMEEAVQRILLAGEPVRPVLDEIRSRARAG